MRVAYILSCYEKIFTCDKYIQNMCVCFAVGPVKKKFESHTSIALQRQRGTNANIIHKVLGTQFIDVPTLKPHYSCSSKPTDLTHHAHWQPALPRKSSADRWEGAATHQLLLRVTAPFLAQARAGIRKRTPFPKENGAEACTDGKHRAPRPASQPAAEPEAAPRYQQTQPYLP